MEQPALPVFVLERLRRWRQTEFLNARARMPNYIVKDEFFAWATEEEGERAPLHRSMWQEGRPDRWRLGN